MQTLADNLIAGDKLSQRTVAVMNKVAILLCAGDLFNAKQSLDELLCDENLPLITQNMASDGVIPSYLVQQLVYFFLKTKNYKLARHLAKYRRFIIDTNHIDPASVSQPQRNMSNQQERTFNKTYVSISKNFT